MNIHEYQAKKILKDYGAPVSNGVVIFNIDEIKNEIKKLKSKEFDLNLYFQNQIFKIKKLTFYERIN